MGHGCRKTRRDRQRRGRCWCFPCPCALGFNVLARRHRPGHRRYPVHRGLHRVEQHAAAGQRWSYRAVLHARAAAGAGTASSPRPTTGEGVKFPRWTRLWLKYGIPALIVVIFVLGYAPKVAMLAGACLGLALAEGVRSGVRPGARLSCRRRSRGFGRMPRSVDCKNRLLTTKGLDALSRRAPFAWCAGYAVGACGGLPKSFCGASGAVAAEAGLLVCGVGAPSLRFVNPRNAFWTL